MSNEYNDLMEKINMNEAGMSAYQEELSVLRHRMEQAEVAFATEIRHTSLAGYWGVMWNGKFDTAIVERMRDAMRAAQRDYVLIEQGHIDCAGKMHANVARLLGGVG